MIVSKKAVVTYRYTVATDNVLFDIIKEQLDKGKEVNFTLEVNAMMNEFKGTPAINRYEQSYKQKFKNLKIKLLSATDTCLTYEAKFTETY